MEHEGYFRTGSILKTRGLKGELNFYVDFAGLEKIKYDTVFIEIGGRLAPYFVTSVKYQPNGIAILSLDDIDTIEKAAVLVKKDVYLPDVVRPKKKKAEFTLLDLEGFTAIDEEEGELGRIAEVNEYPQQVLATVIYKDRDVLFPLNEAIIKAIDVKKKVVYVELPDGLLDIYLE